MKVVSLEWFEQSLERGMVLDETFYQPTMPVEERGVGAWDRREFSSPAIGKRTRDAEPSQALNPFRRKLRRAASTKMGSQSEALWAGITAASFERQHDDGDDWTEEIVVKPDTLREHTPATDPQYPTAPNISALPDAPAQNPACDAIQPLVPSPSPTGNTGNGIFEGRIVFPYGFDNEKVDICIVNLDLANNSADQHSPSTSARPRRTSSAEYRVQHFLGDRSQRGVSCRPT
jgi:DNA replication regulator DPB11